MSRRQQLWQEFLLGEDVHEKVVSRGDWAVGDDDFRREWAAMHGRPAPRPRGRPRKVTATAEIGK